MKFQGAVIEEQGVTFGVAIVKRSVLETPSRREEAHDLFAGLFEGLPVVLMAQDSRGSPTYWGRPDLSGFMADVPLDAVPWREYRVSGA
jgi:hypothetical protein